MNSEQSDTSLTVRRTYDAPLERVYRAFTDPDELAQWYAPGEMTTEVHTLKPEPGGTISVTMVGDDEDHTAEGTFEDVIENERLVHTWRWVGGSMDEDDEESLVTVTFEEVEAGTEVVLTHERLPNSESVRQHTEGWTGCLENLARALDS